ncbi:hypothetical protein ACFSHR_21330 [Azotobacter chroococcum]
MEGELRLRGEALAQLADESKRKDEALERLESEVTARAEALGNVEARLQFLEEAQDRNAGRNRLALAAVAGLALVSLGWQLAGLVGGEGRAGQGPVFGALAEAGSDQTLNRKCITSPSFTM